MKFSIITPCLNSEKYISQAIESVISQEGNFEIEYIIVDGGSSDSTISIVKGFINILDKKKYAIKCNNVKVVFISEKDTGLYDALSKGFNSVTGDIIAYINSDDYYLPNAFENIMPLFIQGNRWVTGLPVAMNEDGVCIKYPLPLKFNSNLIRKGFSKNPYFLARNSYPKLISVI